VWEAGRKRMMKSLPWFAGRGGAREFAEKIVRELADGSQVPISTAAEARDALAMRDSRAAFKHETGRSISPIQVVTEYLAAMRKRGARPLSEAVAGYYSPTYSQERGRNPRITSHNRCAILEAAVLFETSRQHLQMLH